MALSADRRTEDGEHWYRVPMPHGEISRVSWSEEILG